MMRALLLLMCAVCTFGQGTPKGPALQGLDPVLLTEGRDVDGKDSITVQRGRFLYQFSSEETRAKFNREPERYAIQLEGACARMGPPAGGNPDAYVVHDGRIYIMGSDECYRHFKAAPAKYLESAQPKQEWNPAAAERAKGAALLKKAMDALGGADRFAVKAYVETRKQESPNGSRTTSRAALLPAPLRTETKGGENRFGNLVTPEGGRDIFGREGKWLPAGVGARVLRDWRHDLLSILTARGGSDLEGYAAGDVEVVCQHRTGSGVEIEATVGGNKSGGFRRGGPR